MSRLRTSAALGGLYAMCPNDDSIQPPWYSSFTAAKGRNEILWPRSGFRTAGLTIAEAWLNNANSIWEWTVHLDHDGGIGARRNTISGVTRDSIGAAVAGATVKLFRTVNDELLDTVTSDANGNYVATTPYGSEAVYAVTFKAGSPMIVGATVNTLAPI